MKKIININLSGRVIPIEDTAYESLQRYIESLRRYFNNEEGRDEIINDIESRIAELMSDSIKKGASAITDTDIEEIIHSMGRVEDFEEATATEAKASTASQSYSSGPQQQFKTQRGRLYREKTDKIIGGVGSGIANYLDVDPAVVRILLVLFGFTGTGIVLYFILWIVLPARDLNGYAGKRLFRNPDDKVFAGVAGGLAAYFNKPSWVVRLLLAAPLLLNIMFGTFNGIFFAWHRDIFPNIFIAPFTGTFVIAYIILWMVLPEARSSFEKMEMRGEKVDVNRIRQNVKEEMDNFKTKAEAWGDEVKTTAQQFSERAKDFANTRGKAFAGELAQTARPVAGGILHIIGVIIKAFFIFIAGCIALGLFAALMVLIFGGVAWWPINNFLWTSSWQKTLAWGTILLFLAVPVVGFLIWLIRRVVRTRTRSRHLGWIFGGLWSLGWICAVLFAISIAKDLRSFERTNAQEVPITQPSGKMLVRVNEPVIRYNGNMRWIHSDNAGWDINEESLKYNNVKLRIDKSEDSMYHVRVYKYSAGSNVEDAQQRAMNILFNVSSQDSILNMGSGITINRESKFRGQGLIMEILVPVGKKISFDESLQDAYSPWIVRRSERGYERRWGRNYDYQGDWDYDSYFNWDTNVDYLMTSNGKLVDAEKITRDENGFHEKRTDRDSLKLQIEEREKQNEKDRQRLDELNRRHQDSLNQSRSGFKPSGNKKEVINLVYTCFIPLII